MTEEWRAIPKWEGLYEVSDLGRVRSLDRTIETARGPRQYRGKILRPGVNRHGYPLVVLSRPGLSVSKKVHRLVLEVFVGPCAFGMEACHRDGDRSNGQLANLRWGTASSNAYDRIRHGTHPQSQRTHCPRGHAYTPGNIKRIPSRPTARYCRACHREQSRRPQTV